MEEAPAEVTVSPEHNFFFVFSEYQEIRIFFDDVLYVEGLKDYVKIYTTQQVRPILSRLTLKAIEAKLPEKLFCRVHKSFIVALPKITAFQRTRLFIGTQEIPVGSSYVDEFERQYGVH
ncbi:MAG: LytTR family transcriptional regulator [Cytophagaceae bacterium]|nr:MAG: LytTR family transcriptional regulator [Cytophagaceae bacterium]